MGWKGTVRKIQATARKIDREQKRRQKELERQQKEYDKMEALEQAAYEIEVFNNYIDRLKSLHKECGPRIDWEKIKKETAPKEPKPSNRNELTAKKNIETFKPNLFQKLMGKSDKALEDLKRALADSIQQDKIENEAALVQFQKDLSDWESQQDLVKRLIDREPGALLDAIKEFGKFNEISELGSKLNFRFKDNAFHITVEIHGERIIPSEQKSLLKSGKLSIKKMPKGLYYECYQDYVASCVLRIARETYAILPIEMVVITAVDEVLNTSTGHLEKQPILSSVIPKKTLQKLNLDFIDPSDSMSNFVHNMDFKKTKGFMPVEEVQLSQ